MRDRLIELIQQATTLYLDYLDSLDQNGLIDTEGRSKFIADHLLANGVIVPPCKVGDIIYHLHPNHNNEWGIEEKEVLSVMIDKQGIKIYAATMELFWSMHFGICVFLTKEEAEKALAEKNKNN
jgi:hypothetical protein